MPDYPIVLDIDDTLMLERYYVRSGLEAVGAWASETLGIAGVSEVAWSVRRGARQQSAGNRPAGLRRIIGRRTP